MILLKWNMYGLWDYDPFCQPFFFLKPMSVLEFVVYVYWGVGAHYTVDS